MTSLLTVSPSPHVRSGMTTQKIMLLVVLALVPAIVAATVVFGPRALFLVVFCAVISMFTEMVCQKLMQKETTYTDGSAMLTGVLLALNLPSGATWWMAVLGGVFAILVVKQLFGGLGQNIMNPALAARCFLMISFAARMTDFSTSDSVTAKLVDTVSGATPLAEIKAGGSWDLMSMFLGNTRGTIGETSALLLLIGGIFLVVMKIIDLRIPLTYIGTFAVFALLFGGHGFDLSYVAAELCGGGLMLGAWFMATDYVTRPVTGKGQYVYGVILGILTGVFRIFGGSAEGVSYAIIFTNLLVPIIERLTLPGGFGIVKQKGGKKS